MNREDDHAGWSAAKSGHSLVASLKTAAFQLRNYRKEAFDCPVCTYKGPFRDVSPMTGRRRHAKCPRCGSLERHRLQQLAMGEVLKTLDPSRMRMLHFAPEASFGRRFASMFATYETADLNMPGVDHHVDLQALPFTRGGYDIVYASHVLEHVPDDHAALAEIRRILAPGGVAILPVPLVSLKTIEYPAPNPHEAMHVRAPGEDYFDRLKPHFDRIDLYRSEDFPARHQLFSHEDRETFNPAAPMRVAMPGTRHGDVVPVCYV